jgi:hypothetical protein
VNQPKGPPYRNPNAPPAPPSPTPNQDALAAFVASRAQQLGVTAEEFAGDILASMRRVME